jgi:hypothetical protein
MMSTSQSGVIACHSINTPRPEVTPQKSSPLKAWPAIKEWNRYCVLPTIGALYRPDLLPNPSGAISSISAQDWTLLEEMLEEIIRWFPNPEQFMSQLMPMFEEYHQMIGEYFQSHFGIEHDKQELQHALANVLTSLGEHEATKYPPTIETSKLFPATSEIAGELDSANALSFIAELSNKMLTPDDTYSTEHEIGHLYSFQLTRPAITQFKATWSATDDLLQEAAAGAHDNFWNKFVDLNNKLMNCLSKSLSLEELRANLWALSLLPPEMRTIFIDSIYGQENEYTSKKEREIFKSLQYLTGGRLMTALLLTLLAECLDPFNPENKLEQVQDSLKVQNAHTWSDEQWASWFQSWSNKLDTWKLF